MGLIKNIAGAIGSANRTINQSLYTEYFTAGDMSGDILMKRAELVNTKGSVNTKNDTNVITDGSAIDVQHNQCMIIVENGKIVEACMEPGRYIYNNDIAPSFFAGNESFNRNFISVANEMWGQIKMGGQRRNTQRVYFINMGILDSPVYWGLGNVTFRHCSKITDNMPAIRINMLLKGNGVTKVRIIDPLSFFVEKGAQKAGGDNDGVIKLSDLQNTLLEPARSKIRMSITTAITELGNNAEIAYTEIMTTENAVKIEEIVNNAMKTTELGQCGFGFTQFSVNGAFVPRDEDIEKLTKMESELGSKVFMASDAGLAQYDVMKTAAENQGGAANGFVGVGMMGFGTQQINNAGGLTGMENKPTPANAWKCSCGATATGNFCQACGAKRPGRVPLYNCDKCGWIPTDPKNPPRFCPNCGDKFDEGDAS